MKLSGELKNHIYYLITVWNKLQILALSLSLTYIWKYDGSDSLLSTEHIPQWMVAHHTTICYISTLLECHWITSQIYPVCSIRPWINCCDHILIWTTKFSMILGIGWNDSIGQYLSAYWICCRLCLFFLVVCGVWQIIIVLNFWQVSANLHWCISYWKVLLWLDQPKQ